MCGRWLSVLGTSLTITISAAAQEPAPPADPRPPYERLLAGDDARRADALQEQINADEEADRYADAIRRHEKLLALRTEIQGADHWETISQKWNLDVARRVANLTAVERASWRTARAGAIHAEELRTQGRPAEAQRLLEEFHRKCAQLCGDRHPETAMGSGYLARSLSDQGKYAESQPLLQQALDVRRELLGEKHPFTATSYSDLATCLDAQAQHASAEVLYVKALDLRREVQGEKHVDTAAACSNLASSVSSQGRQGQAQLLLQQALALLLELIGEQHPLVASVYNNLAATLIAQGRYGDAEPYLQKALDLFLNLVGERHPVIPGCYDGLAVCLGLKGEYAAAQRLHEKSLRLNLQIHGDKHPAIAFSYTHLGGILTSQGKHVEAETFLRQAHDLWRELLGEKHPLTTASCMNLGLGLDAQSRHVDALPLLERARDISRELFGDHHFMTAGACLNLAHNLVMQGHAATALPELLQSARGFEVARQIVADQGLERAGLGAAQSPYPLLAAVQAQLGDRLAAWDAAESDLARGLSDEGASRRRRILSTDQQAQQDGLADRLNQLDAVVLQLVSRRSLSEAEQAELARLQSERRDLEAQLREFVVSVTRHERASLRALQDSLPADAALLLWLDVSRPDNLEEHWGCVVRASGDPQWERLRGSGPDAEWTAADGDLPRTFCEAITAADAVRTDRSDLTNRLRAQRLAPLEKHLQGVQRLYVVSVNRMACVPVDVLTDKYVVSYVPSGTFLAHQNEQSHAELTSVLALGDPVYSNVHTSKAAMRALLSRGSEWAELPGTSLEVARLQAIVGQDQTTALTRSDASEQALEQLRVDGTLEKFRYLHFATHGEPNNARAFESALVLAQDQVTGEIPKAGRKYYDGRLTANEVLENWELNADLVTLSACESALGRPGGGDGLLGFAQAFLLAGARSVCLSLWKVDDTATALLMDRFYQNLLGKREGLKHPLPKAEALSEAKQWLRNLTLDDATQLAADLSHVVARGKSEPALALAVPSSGANTADSDPSHPFGHPRYWAAFMLIGDPD